MIPQSIGRYRIIDKIGAGGMAVVFLAQDSLFERQVAVKVLASNLFADPENRERFRRESKSIAHLEHAAAVPVYDYGEDGEHLFLVMRYMQGGSLKDRLSHGPLPPPAAADILRRIASALDKAHSLGMVHRDVKPANILFDSEGNPYITDFGLVKLVEASVQLTHSEFFGTPAYTSPEQCQGEMTVDFHADVYSLTAVLFHMLTGSPPYQAQNTMALLMKHVSDPIPRLEDAAPGLSSAMQPIIDRGMAKNPSQRYGSTGGLAKDLDRVLASSAGAIRPEPRGTGSEERILPAESLPATESASVATFDLLRRKRQAPAPKADEIPTRRDSPATLKKTAGPVAAPPPAPPQAVAQNIPKAERRRLEWRPQEDVLIPPDKEGEAIPAAPVPSSDPVPSAYSAPWKPAKGGIAGIPILVIVVILLAISVLYILVEKHLF
jgi:serine/threonine protein kinase